MKHGYKIEKERHGPRYDTAALLRQSEQHIKNAEVLEDKALWEREQAAKMLTLIREQDDGNNQRSDG
jgi:hypothetical protein